VPSETVRDAIDRATDAYDALGALGEEIEDEWSYVMDLGEAWRARFDAVATDRGDDPLPDALTAALDRAIDEIARIEDPHRAIDRPVARAANRQITDHRHETGRHGADERGCGATTRRRSARRQVVKERLDRQLVSGVHDGHRREIGPDRVRRIEHQVDQLRHSGRLGYELLRALAKQSGQLARLDGIGNG
jgi:hypothetical protein